MMLVVLVLLLVVCSMWLCRVMRLVRFGSFVSVLVFRCFGVCVSVVCIVWLRCFGVGKLSVVVFSLRVVVKLNNSRCLLFIW